MSAVAITIAALKSITPVVALVEERIDPIVASEFTEQDAPRKPGIVVNLIHEADEAMLQGQAAYFEARISIECRALRGSQVMRLGEAVKTGLAEIKQAQVAGHEATFFKEGTDATGYRDDIGVAHRTIDFYLRWR